MKRSSQSVFLCAAAFGLIPFAAVAQSIPANVGSVPGVGFQIPRLGGTLSYGVSAAELISTGFYNSGVAATTNLDGDLAYLSSSVSHPFDAVYTGGVLVGNNDQPTTMYQDLSLSQALRTRNWNFDIQDSVSYLPESPVTGLSGIPGVGDLGIDPVPVGPASGIGILTTYGPRVSNTLAGSASRMITPHLSAQASGFDGIQRFIGDNAYQGIDNNSEGGSAGLSYRFDARNTLSGSYNYSNFGFSGSGYSYTAQGGTIDYSRVWTRKFTTDAFIGPQYLQQSGVAGLPSSTQIAGGVGAAYAGRQTSYSLNFTRGANNGSGVVPGSFSDNVIVAAHRQFARVWNVSASISYSKNSSLPVFETFTFDSNALAFGGQVSRGFGRYLSGYASYTVERQSTSGNALALNAFDGVYQVVAIGISYSPRAINLGR